MLLLDGEPVDPVGNDNPLVADVELHAAGLVEVLEGHLYRFFRLVHAYAPVMCGDFGHPPSFLFAHSIA